MNTNNFVYTDEKLGHLLVEDIDGTHCRVRALKPNYKEDAQLNASWWDLDTIKNEIDRNRTALTERLKTNTDASVQNYIKRIVLEIGMLPKEEQFAMYEGIINHIKGEQGKC